ncbi:MAG: CopG family transcriptional regulator [Chloroflexi bacterium]|nr:CopG family transcriptional regulator [Chloroflexota bacterium]
MAVRKWSVSIEERLAERVESHVGDRGLSGFVARAIERELERDLLDEYLRDLDAEFGPVPDELVEQFDQLWPS